MTFEQHGYFKDYYLNGKYIGSVKSEKDREVFGYLGRKTEVTEKPIIFSKTKKVKAGAEVVTELQIICGKMISENVSRETMQ